MISRRYGEIQLVDSQTFIEDVRGGRVEPVYKKGKYLKERKNVIN